MSRLQKYRLKLEVAFLLAWCWSDEANDVATISEVGDDGYDPATDVDDDDTRIILILTMKNYANLQKNRFLESSEEIVMVKGVKEIKYGAVWFSRSVVSKLKR